MIRYIVVDRNTNERLAWAFDKQKALSFMRKYEYECVNQDSPYTPKLEIIKEEINE